MTIINPPPQAVPNEYKDKSPKVRDYEERQKEVIRLLWENQSGASPDGAPTASDEFARRYALLVHR